ncbi:MAG: hypothetical protein HUJ76_11110, partial [Parasporobacterium sp.]|nr:hypothetical protein [Parasporobacterium sp.]
MQSIPVDYLNNEENRKRAQRVVNDITRILRAAGAEKVQDVMVTRLAYALYKTYSLPESVGYSYEDMLSRQGVVLNANVKKYIDMVNPDTWHELKALTGMYSAEDFAGAAALPFGRYGISSYSATPASVVKLAEKILDIRPQERAADMGCGAGSFLLSAAAHHPESRFTGFDTDIRFKQIIDILSDIYG